jgi:hypothetical protein
LRSAYFLFGGLIGLTPQYCTCCHPCRCAIDNRKVSRANRLTFDLVV